MSYGSFLVECRGNNQNSEEFHKLIAVKRKISDAGKDLGNKNKYFHDIPQEMSHKTLVYVFISYRKISSRKLYGLVEDLLTHMNMCISRLSRAIMQRYDMLIF